MNWKVLLILPLLIFIFQGAASQEKEEMVKIRGYVETASEKPVANAFIFIDGICVLAGEFISNLITDFVEKIRMLGPNPLKNKEEKVEEAK